ncbi:putative CDP-alcohol phosphatidyltransferase class-I family protein [Zancudomyces culisetae]|uniref:Putative CDP-alcohol phosphatidyltransferase class-I family protein n=1 Tax=Zancudomyces culisetae TaxID=1213189 RepID=A0A1R1PMC4_ZANCU|nr:putative CDP-alcohol phosphatidyltransferase class-I family protein [Zancudomyces culisetae]|eukprot:OMH82097.1 putative CDP-alcohol phosphatidyltransferase class-I family protein [Zancudomyces culisetae]
MNPKSLASQNITIENHSLSTRIYYTLNASSLAQSVNLYSAIGDNPLSDIVGANRQGWGSVLVRTGVYNEKTHALHPELHQVPSHIADDVYEAVKWIAES